MRSFDSHLITEHDFILVPAKAWQDDAWQRIDGTALAPQSHQVQKHLFPVLVPTRTLDLDSKVTIWNALESWGHYNDSPFIGALLRASEPDRVAAHLRRVMVLKQAGKPDNLLRFYDPRVYRHFLWILDSEQLTALMGPIQAWCWQDGSGAWRSDDYPGPPAPSAMPQYSPEQVTQITRIEWTERAINMLRTTDPALVADEPAAAQRIDALLATAMQRHGLTRDGELDLFIKQAFTAHPRIHTHPRMRARLAKAAAGRNYRGLCQDLTPEILNQYAHELEHYAARADTSPVPAQQVNV